MNFKTIVIAFGLVSSTFVFSQDEEKIDTLNVLDQRVTSLEDAAVTNKKLKISGYIQTQWQSSQIDVNNKASQDMKVGAAKAASETTDINRFGIRRGRIKVAYDDSGYQGVLQFDMTEKGVALKDAYLVVIDPWVGFLSLKGGIYDRPFGYEISYSSSRRESPERSRIFQTLFPDERDLGAMLILQAPKTSPWNVLKLEAGLFAGNGIYLDTDSKKDFIGHLSYNKVLTSNIKVGLGTSLYSGSVAQTDTNVYVMDNGTFKRNIGTSPNGFAKRQYIGFDGQFSMNSVLGLTTIRAEYIYGQQPGRSDNSSSPKSGLIPGKDASNNDVVASTTYATTATGTPLVYTTKATAGTATGTPTYLRKMAGGYVHFIQDIADTKHSIVLKYDWYDPNVGVAKDNIGAALTAVQIADNTAATTAKRPVPYAASNKTDIAYSTLGVGYMYRMNNNVRIMAYYDMPINEISSNMIQTFKDGKLQGTDFTSKLAANLLTVRIQYKF